MQPNAGDFVEIVGVSSCHVVNDPEHGNVTVRMLRPVSGESFKVLKPAG